MKINLLDYSLKKLEELVVSYNQKPFRARQLYKWIYEKEVYDFDKMTDISKSFIDVLKNDFEIVLPSIYTKQISNDGTIKLLLELSDGAKIETVLMRYAYGNAACVTSEVGCNMGCVFCASGLMKKQRELKPSEMIGQILVLNEILKNEETPSRVSHIVVMGTGEPFDNYDNVMDFVRIANSPFALAIGARHITISTCGIPDRIKQYALEGLQTNLAISLHAPNDEIRHKIMPVSYKYPMDELMDAVNFYLDKAKRRVTFEYILIKDVNDSLECAEALCKLVSNICAYVNLIPYNEVMENKYHRPSNNSVHRFFDYLMSHKINATIRKEFGNDIDAACGQLRAKEEKKL